MMHKALKQFGFMVNFDEVVLEGYLVLNPDSKVAKLTQSNTNIDIEDVEQDMRKWLMRCTNYR